MSLNFDSDTWYQVNVTKFPEFSFLGTSLYNHDGTTGAVFYEATNTSKPGQKWQFYPFNSSAYLLRCQDGGPDAYLAVAVGTPETKTSGRTIAIMASYTILEDSMFWQIQPWGDGTYYFTNLANGTDWHLNVLDTGLLAMDSNIMSTQVGEHYTFTSLSTIGDSRFSTAYSTIGQTALAVASTTVDTSATTAPPAFSTQDSGSDKSRNVELSTGAAVGIGIVVGLVVVIIICFLGLIIVRKQQRTKDRNMGTTAMAGIEYCKSTEPEGGIHDMIAQGTHTETPTSPTSIRSLQGEWAPPAELQGDDARYYYEN